MHRHSHAFRISTVADGDNGGGEHGQDQAGPETTTADGTKPETDPTFTQADLARVIKDRLTRERKATVEKYGDLDELKKAASRLQEIEDANKTEHQRAADELAALKAAAAQSKAEAVRYRVAATNGVAGDDMDLLGVGDEDVLTARAKRIGVLVAAERELEELKKASEEAGKRAPVSGRPVAPGWPGATPVQDGRPSARDAGLAAARARGHAQVQGT